MCLCVLFSVVRSCILSSVRQTVDIVVLHDFPFVVHAMCILNVYIHVSLTLINALCLYQMYTRLVFLRCVCLLIYINNNVYIALHYIVQMLNIEENEGLIICSTHK